MTSAGILERVQPAQPGGPGGCAHPIVAFSARLAAALDRLSDAPAWSMTPEEERTVLVELAASAARLSELGLRVLAAADRDDVGKINASATTGAWYAAATRTTRPAAHADVTLALALDGPFEATRAALAVGRVDTAQARVIVRAVTALPDQVGVEDRRVAEEHLIALAADHDAAELKVLGRRIFEVIAPDAAEEYLGRQLAREEAQARRKTVLVMWDHDDGTSSGRFKIPTLHAQMLAKAFDAFTAPRRIGPDARKTADGSVMGRPELAGMGLCELIERFPTDGLPDAGGVNATVVVTMTLDQLRTELAAACLDTGGLVSAGEARRLACGAGIIPVVLDGDGVVLDVGRQQRLFNRDQRIAGGIGRATCAEAHCDRPTGWTEGHHRTPWALGGTTDLKELI